MIEFNTKEKIIKASKELFAKKGFKGTSIRDIAQRASVNIGAVNYHFKSKELLYCHIFQLTYEWVEEYINQLAQDDSLDLKEFSWKVFEFFLINKSAVLNTFKMITDEEIELPDEAFLQSTPTLGPPGAEMMKLKFLKSIGSKKEKDIDWLLELFFQPSFIGPLLPILLFFVKNAKEINSLM